MKIELWKAISGYEGLYEISNQGRIRTVGRNRKSPTRNADNIKRLNNANNNYPRITLFKNGAKRTRLVHRLVVEEFIGEIPLGMDINHKDGNKANNCIENLEIVTRLQNARHAIEIGLTNNRGENNPMAKLTRNQVLEIRKKLPLESGYKYAKLAREFGVSPGTISFIDREITWRDIR